MYFVSKEYGVGAVSPIAFDLDNERDVLNSEAFHLVEAYENGVSEGNTALGLCILTVS